MKKHLIILFLSILSCLELFAGETSPSSLLPSWVLTPQSFADPLASCKPEYISFLDSTNNGDMIFNLVEGNTANNLKLWVALVSGATGKVLWRTPLTDRPAGTWDYVFSHLVTPNGRIILCSASYEDVKSNMKLRQGARVHLRGFDSVSGKLLSHTRLTFDNPTSDAASGLVNRWGETGVAIGLFKGVPSLVTPYFLAEMDKDFTQVLHETKPRPENVSGNDLQEYASLPENKTKQQITASVVAGSVIIEIIDVNKKPLSPQRKFALNLPSPAKTAYIKSPNSTKIHLIEIFSEDGKTAYCSVPLLPR
jgi:hypothetical protein